MIVLFRVDERLVHGQIAVAWSKTLNVTHIVVANDDVINSDIQIAALKMAAPASVKIAIRDVTGAAEVLQDVRLADKRVMVVVKTVADALRLVKKVPDVLEVNIGNYGFLGDTVGKTEYSRYIRLNAKDIEELKEIQAIAPVVIQVVPNDSKRPLSSILKGE